MELKFRARDGYNIRYDITWFEHWHLSSNEMKWIFIKWDYYEIKTTPVMQYTWLKDKNWKEIYEGDIVKNKQAWSILEERPVWEIRWEDNGMWIWDRWWKWDYKHSFDSINDSEILDKYWYPNDGHSSLWLEVIWNIYEDKHLLTN